MHYSFWMPSNYQIYNSELVDRWSQNKQLIDWLFVWLIYWLDGLIESISNRPYSRRWHQELFDEERICWPFSRNCGRHKRSEKTWQDILVVWPDLPQQILHFVLVHELFAWPFMVRFCRFLHLILTFCIDPSPVQTPKIKSETTPHISHLVSAPLHCHQPQLIIRRFVKGWC